MGGLIKRTNAAGSTFQVRPGGGNFINRIDYIDKDGVPHTIAEEGVWLPTGTGETNLGSKGTVDASIAGSASVQAGRPNRSKGQSINFSPNKRRVSKSNAGSTGSSRALNIV